MRVTIATSSHWSVTAGKSYDVFEVDMSLNTTGDERIMFRVVGDNGEVAYVPLAIVALVPGYSTDHAIFPSAAFLEVPAGWVLETRNNWCSLGPREISSAGYRGMCSFWEDFYDGDTGALRTLAVLLREECPESWERFRLRYSDLLKDA